MIRAGVGDDVGREEGALERVVPDPGLQALDRTVRLRPSSPPTPFSVNPKPSWIGRELDADEDEQ